MKKRINKLFIVVFAMVLLIAGTPLTVCAATANGYLTAEEMRQFAAARQKALDEAIANGQIPKGTTVDDCYFSTDKNGNISVVTIAEITAAFESRQSANTKPAAKETAPATQLTGDELEVYAQEVFALVNKERENAGVAPLDYDYSLQEAAMIRAGECASMNSLYVDGVPHIRPDGSRWFTVLGIEKNYNYGENSAGDYRSPEAVVNGWMASDGHRAKILKEEYSNIGVGVRQAADGKFYWIQIFYRP